MNPVEVIITEPRRDRASQISRWVAGALVTLALATIAWLTLPAAGRALGLTLAPTWPQALALIMVARTLSVTGSGHVLRLNERQRKEKSNGR